LQRVGNLTRKVLHRLWAHFDHLRLVCRDRVRAKDLSLLVTQGDGGNLTLVLNFAGGRTVQTQLVARVIF